MRKCVSCKLAKDDSEFGVSSKSSDGLNTRCKQCNRESAKKYRDANPEKIKEWKRTYDASLTKEERSRRHRWQRYGLTPISLYYMLAAQDFKCFICRTEINEESARVDHDHSHCGKDKACDVCIRGLLCDNCNKMLGHAKDSVEILKKGVLYLEGYQRTLELDLDEFEKEFPISDYEKKQALDFMNALADKYNLGYRIESLD